MSINKNGSSPINIPEFLEFQLCDWNSYHEIDGDNEEKYVIQLFGRTADDKDVCLKVTDFTPFFYVEVPDQWKQFQVDRFVEILKNKAAWTIDNSIQKTSKFTNNNPGFEIDMIKNSLIKYCLMKKHKFYNFNKKKYFNFIILVFKSHNVMREYSYMLSYPIDAKELTKNKMFFQRYESNIEPHIRFMHINNLLPCGWITIDKTKLKLINEYSKCDHSYEVNWKYVKPCANNDKMAPFKIMGYDIECVSCDHNFPRADRKTDEIIQIGMTMYRHESMTCYEEHIVTLGKCDQIKKANVKCYDTERKLIRGWAKMMSKIRPDIKAGYNNFGFDDKYIYDRIARIDREEAETQRINVKDLKNKFMDEILQILGKVNNKYLMDIEGLTRSVTYFEVKKLSSSALGDNELHFFQVPGMVSIDMMKVIQRDHRLISYKLDNVSANFITEKTIKVDKGEQKNEKVEISIYTASTKALDKNSYIQIMIDDGYSSSPLCENAKYKVHDITTVNENHTASDGKDAKVTYQCIKTFINQKDVKDFDEVLSNKLLKVYWTFAKDDMHHTLINKYFREQNSEKIKQVAKYCIKDCKLVNLLLAKLEIIINSVGMANVCNVPLSYLFLRGQGVKIFSLVSKKCREKNFLIPVIRKKDNKDEEDETYEGATVITPIPDVYLSPIGVLDYNSLYPNSMRERNLSPECYVNDLEFSNSPGYVYHEVSIVQKDKRGKIIRNIDGTKKKEYHRYAQELITEEEINLELKDVFDKINTRMSTNIDIIKQQIYFTPSLLKEKLDIAQRKYEKEIKGIKDDKLLNSINEEYDNNTKKLFEIYEKIIKENNNLENKIKEINNDVNLSISKKNKLSNIEQENSHYIIKKILKQVKLTENDKKMFIELEKNNAQNNIEEEKTKKYNIVNGKPVRYGILPEILTELLNKRQETKKRLEKENDPSLKSILNGLELAYKVTANSLYGQTGAPTSPIFFMPIAASTTAIGRERLYYAKKIVEDNFPNSEIIYGDSVTGDTPIIYKDIHNNINNVAIENLGSEWIPYHQFKKYDSSLIDKQQSIVNAMVWTSNGWAKVRRVIRHKTTKKIYRVQTYTSCIDVTEDHSLLDINKNIIKPTMCCKNGTKLLHGFMPTNDVDNQISQNEAFIWGSYMINDTVTPENIYIWLINNPALKILEENIDLGEEYFRNRYSSLFYCQSSVHKIVPKEILNSNNQIKKSFLEGYFSNKLDKIYLEAKYPVNKILSYHEFSMRKPEIVPNEITNNGIEKIMAEDYLEDKLEKGILSYQIKSKINAQSFFYLLKSIGYNINFYVDPVSPETYHLRCFKETLSIETASTVVDIKIIGECHDYVYDLETVDGTFHAGIGELIVKNTDSIFINFHLKDEDGNEKTDTNALIETIKLCKQAAATINSNLPKPQRILYEKTFNPFILISKKKYVGFMFFNDEKKYFLKSMGIVLKRRDNAPIVKIVVGGIIESILKNRNIDKAIEYTKIVLKKLMNGEYPIDKFIISKNLRGNYKQKRNAKTGKLTALPAHKVLADRMALRDPGNKPQINDRIPFVYIVKDMGKKKKKDILQGDLIEHPAYVVEHKLKIDYMYYLEHQIINPAEQILELMMSIREVKKLFNSFLIEEDNKRIGRQSMEKWMDNYKVKAIEYGSKTQKNHHKSTKNKSQDPSDLVYANLPFIGKTKRLECKDLNKWMLPDANNDGNDWEPTF